MTFLLAGWLTSQSVVVDIEVTGNVRTADETVLAYVRSLQGMPADDEALAAAFRSLWDTGLFEDIRFRTEPVPGGLLLVVEVVERPTLGIVRFEGDIPRGEQELRDALQEMGAMPRPDRPFGEEEARRAAQALTQFLGDSYEVEASVEPTEDGRSDLVLDIRRGNTVRIARLVFVGNEALDEATLLSAMRSRPSGWTTWITRRDRLSQRAFEEDLARVRGLYRSLGYLHARVGPPRVDEKDGRASIEVPIYEGDRFVMGEATIEPGSLLRADEARQWIPLGSGDVFDAGVVRRAGERIERHYRNRGYPAVRVDVEEKTRPDGRTADVHIVVTEGSFYRVGRIELRGNTRYRDTDLRQYLDLTEGDRFSQSALESSVQALMGLGSFRSVHPEVDLVTVLGAADVILHLEEIPAFDYLVGGGVNPTRGATGSGQILAHSPFGRGATWKFDLDLGNRFQNFNVGYRDPFTVGHRLTLGVDFARSDLTFPDETSQDAFDFRTRVSGPSGKRWQFLTGLRLAQFTMGSSLEGNVPFLTEFLGERFRTHRIDAALRYDGRDRPFFSTRGVTAQLDLDLAGGVLGGDIDLVRAGGEARTIFPLNGSRRHLAVFSARVQGVWPWGKAEADGLPRFERLFLGGENDMRGFDVRGVGPTDANGVVVGGDRLVFASAEYQFSLSSRLRLVGFFDVGNVYATDFEGVPMPALRFDAGAELDFLAPVLNVPLRIGYGFNLEPLPHESRGRFYVALSLRF